MKKTIIASLFVLLGVTSCDFLNEVPQDKLSPETYFRTETDLQLFTNPLYDNLLDKDTYEHQSDHCVHLNLSKELHGGTFRTVPATGGGWNWGNLRRINTFLAYSHNCSDEAVVTHYNAIARFFRAMFYFDKVKRFGDVPWIDVELGSEDERLYAPRDSREFILEKMIEDVDFAIENLPEAVSTFRVNKWAALALKAEFCLHEGTFRKYHAGHQPTLGTLPADAKSADYFLELASAAAKEVMECGFYSLASDYRMLFAQDDADPKEYILAIKNDLSLQIYNNSTAYATMPTQGTPGATKKFVNSYLMKDGTRFTDATLRPNWETMSFIEECADRDPRLAASIVTPGHKRLGGTMVTPPDLGCSSTGYQLSKWVMDETLPQVNRVDMSYNDMPVFRLAEMYLIYAEALAEHSSYAVTQDDIDMSINKLRDRVGMPHLKIGGLTADPYLTDPKYGYTNPILLADNDLALILEIRRERAVELFKEGFRWDDLMRWKEGKCIEQEMHGIYFAGLGEYDLSGDNKADVVLWKDTKPAEKTGVAAFEVGKIPGLILSAGDKGYVNPQPQTDPQTSHVFDENRDYYYPIPSSERSLNPNLTQNPNWKDGLSEEGAETEE